MLYLVSNRPATARCQSASSSSAGTNIDQAQVLVQNRVSVALPRLPQEVSVGVTVRKNSRPDAGHP
jgi:HAE1 family hydrophobic/amphiphilic exporter-1